MARKHTDETKRKISEGVKRTRHRRQAEREKQKTADVILDGFRRGAGRDAAKLSRLAEFREYTQIGKEPITTPNHPRGAGIPPSAPAHTPSGTEGLKQIQKNKDRDDGTKRTGPIPIRKR